jgi:hypothetical protein
VAIPVVFRSTNASVHACFIVRWCAEVRYCRAIHPAGRFGDLSPSSISRRMASDKDGSSGRLCAQDSMRPRKSSETRTPIIGVTPVAGRPRFFCLALFVDVFMNLCLA